MAKTKIAKCGHTCKGMPGQHCNLLRDHEGLHTSGTVSWKTIPKEQKEQSIDLFPKERKRTRVRKCGHTLSGQIAHHCRLPLCHTGPHSDGTTSWEAGKPCNSRTRTKNILLQKGAHCYYCGCSLKDSKHVTLDHVMPSSKGGSNKRENLVLSCSRCNTDKGNYEPVIYTHICVRRLRAIISLNPKLSIWDRAKLFVNLVGVVFRV